MAPRIVWTDAAWDDLDAAAEYIDRDSPQYASAFVRRVLAAVKSLREFPERGRVVPELSSGTIHELLVHNYRLVYRSNDDRIIILGVIHGARDLPTLWGRERRDEDAE